jgi:hypothetical protein
MQWGDKLLPEGVGSGHADGQDIADVMSLAGTKTMAHKCFKAKGGATLRRGLPAVSGML